MKKGIFVLMAIVVIFAGFQPARAQSLDDLVGLAGHLVSANQAKGEKDKLAKASRSYNNDQPEVALAGSRTVVRLPDDLGWFNNRQIGWLKTSIAGILTTVGARPVWDDAEIDKESASRSHHRDNPEVDQSTIPAKGKIKYRSKIVEFDFIEFDRSESAGLDIGSWFRQHFSFSASRETAYLGLIVTVKNGDTGETQAVYKTLGTASTADNLNGFFSNSLGLSYSGNSQEARKFRALENALREMKEVVKRKCSGRDGPKT